MNIYIFHKLIFIFKNYKIIKFYKLIIKNDDEWLLRLLKIKNIVFKRKEIS